MNASVPDGSWEDLQQRVDRLEKRNKKLEKIHDAYKRVCRNEAERVKELKCLYQVAQCVVIEADMDRALGKIAGIIPLGWQYTEQSCARITVKDRCYVSENFFKSNTFQCEKIFFDSHEIGKIEIFYAPFLGAASADPFLIEEKNLLKGIANIISFFLKKLKDDENRKIIQQQLLHADRLATIGQLSAGVAHELNEPLGNILGLAQLALKLPGMPGQAMADLKKIEDCVIYSREIIKKLLDFSRQSSPCKKEVDLHHLIDTSLSFLTARCDREKIEVVRQYTGPITLTADPTQIKQVVTNLAINAIQAMKNGGILTITTRKMGKKAVFAIEDSGTGIPEQHISKAFVPFFTTKDVGEGTGLGLSVVYGIVQGHNGDIKVSSEPGEGTVFQVTLPMEDA